MSKKDLFGYLGSSCRAVKNGWHRFWSWYRNLYKGRQWYVKTLIGIASFIVVFFIYLVAVDINFLWLFGKSPSVEQIMHPKTNDASFLYSADGKLLAKYFEENRTPLKYEEISPNFFTALIDTEDERFYSHHGIDFTGLFAAVKDYALHGHARGASTITQQLVKNMFRVRTQYSTGLLGYIPGVKILIMKSKEWILATEIEMFYDKKQILEMYANTVDFGSNAFGINTAAKTYFDVKPKNLTVEQSAVLVGLLKATTAYNPRLNPKNSLKRRNVVLSNMCAHKHMTKVAYDSISQLPIDLHYNVETAYDGEALYFRDAVAHELKDWCQENDVNLYTDGLKIYTTLDSRMQKYAEQAVQEKMKVVQQNFKNHWGNGDCWLDDNNQPIPGFLEAKARNTDSYRDLRTKYPNNPDSVDYFMKEWKHTVRVFDYDGGHEEQNWTTMDSLNYMLHFMHTGFIAMEPETGYVKAWVGDVDFKTWKYDNALAMHQPGSTFKLFVYTTAMIKGLTPCDKRQDAWIQMDVYDAVKKQMVKWTPTNANGSFSGADMTLRSAFAQSINSVAVRVGNEVGIDSIVQVAHDMGIKSPLKATPALSLGASDVNLLELVNAYSVVANDGKGHDPILVTRIVDRDGKEIYSKKTENHQAIPYRAAYLMQQMLLAGRTDAGGTSMSINAYLTSPLLDTDFGGKTGTSNRHADAWFVGVTPHLVCGAWVGGEYRQIHFRTGALGQGSRTALPICGRFYQLVLSDQQFRQYHGRFGEPKEYIDKAVYQGCQSTYQAARADTIDSIGGDSIEIVHGIGGEETPAATAPEEPGNIDDKVEGAFSKHNAGASKQPAAEPK